MRHFILLIVIACALPSTALGQGEGDDSARHHFRIGQAHYDSGHFLEAAAEFEQSYELSGRPQLLYNIYVSYRDANDTDRARDALRSYLEAMPDAPNRELLRSRLAALDRSRSDAAEPADTGETEPNEADATEPAEATEPSETDPSEAPASSNVVVSPSASDAGGGGMSPVGFILGGAGAALLITSAITGGLALSASDELASTCPMMRCPADYDHEGAASTGSALAVTTDILLPVGAATLLTGIVLILVLQDDSDDVAAACGVGGCTMGARF